jgi:type IV pilus assembly protein PilA
MVKNIRRNGFTIVELLFVLSIIFFLLAVAIPNYSGYKAKAFDTVAKGDLRQAYSSAIFYFMDHPGGQLSLASLEKYGFKTSPNVSLRVINGRPSDLLLISFYNAPGAQAFMTYSPGLIRPGIFDHLWLEPIQGWGSSYNPLTDPLNSGVPAGDPAKNIKPVQVDVLRVCNLETLENLQQAYRVAQAYFRANPEGVVTKDILTAHGYLPNENVNLSICGNTLSELSMAAIFNIPEATYYMIDNSGNISSSTG